MLPVSDNYQDFCIQLESQCWVSKKKLTNGSLFEIKIPLILRNEIPDLCVSDDKDDCGLYHCLEPSKETIQPDQQKEILVPRKVLSSRNIVETGETQYLILFFNSTQHYWVKGCKESEIKPLHPGCHTCTCSDRPKDAENEDPSNRPKDAENEDPNDSE